MRDLTEAEALVHRYIGNVTPLTRLGWGISGFVFLAPDHRTAIKVLHYREAYRAELRTYGILARSDVTSLCGLTVPKLADYRDDLFLIRMDFVSPPYLLDFAGVTFAPPDYSAEVMAEWHESINTMFGPNASIIYEVYTALARLGIYYTDFRPSNINLRGHRDAVADDLSRGDDD